MSGIIFGGTAVSANRNYLINPNFEVVQGTASGTLANSNALPTASVGYSGKTNWYEGATGGTPAYAYSAVNESVTFTGAASTTNIYFGQRIESRDIVTLTNRLATVTLSVELSNSLLTSVTWEVFRATTTDDTHGTIGTPTQTSIASGTFTVNSVLTRYSATFSLPALASRGLDIRFRVGAQTSGTWVIARPQLEEGSTATTFLSDNYTTELSKCQRHYTAATMRVGPAASFATTYTFPSTMFAVPVRTGGGTGYSVGLLNEFGISHAQTTAADQALTFSAHIP
tara:strand:+ start:55 stop:906 length:852 start_codon:yes stop_codon:yes gene_type:complete